jgi:hypothetical protein
VGPGQNSEYPRRLFFGHMDYISRLIYWHHRNSPFPFQSVKNPLDFLPGDAVVAAGGFGRNDAPVSYQSPDLILGEA